MCLTKLGYCGKFYNADGSHFCYCLGRCKLAPIGLNLALELFVTSCFKIEIVSGAMSIESDGSVFIPKGVKLPLDQLHLADFLIKSLDHPTVSFTVDRTFLTPQHLFWFASRYCISYIFATRVAEYKSTGNKIASEIIMVLYLRTVAFETVLISGYYFEPP